MSTALTKDLTCPLQVAEKIRETEMAYSFVLEIPEEHKKDFLYQPGQFVSFRLDVGGEVISRSYSLCSSPLIDSKFQITVKRLPGGKGSNHLIDEVFEGDILDTTPPSGHFFKPPKSMDGTHFVLFAAGSGITPIFSILKSVLEMNPKNKVTLIYGNRNEDDVIYKDELEAWEKKHPDRLRMLHILSRPSSTWEGFAGRVTENTLSQIFSESLHRGIPEEYYLCGPVGFMELIVRFLKDKNVAREQIHQESFGAPVAEVKESGNVAATSPEALEDDDRTLIGAGQESEPEKIVALLDGETIEIAASKEESVLETLLNEGYDPPYSCMEGACMACMGKIVEGKVYQDDPGILTDENIEEKEALTCQAKPLSKVVRVDYDTI